MKGSDFLNALRRKFGIDTDRELAKKIGLGNTVRWRQRKNVTALQAANIVKKAWELSEKESNRELFQPIVEFHPLYAEESRFGAKMELFLTEENGTKNNYLVGLKKELQKHHGIYIFYDSRGRALYAGKARERPLWDEMTRAYNRDRNEVQQIKRVAHPGRSQEYKTANEQIRQIRGKDVQLWELAEYFSAYRVSVAMIDDIEALLIRGFPNDLLNARMEMFTYQRRVKREKKNRK